MRIRSQEEIPRSDLAPLRSLIPGLWTQWRGLRFDERGWVRDDGSGDVSEVLRLTGGRHRVPGATYAIAPPASTTTFSFTLTVDDGRTVAGTLTGGAWSVDVQLGERCSATGRLDVRTMLAAGDVSGVVIGLVGGREATGEILVDPSVLEHRGDLGTGHARAQRATLDGVAHVTARSDAWQCRLTLHVRGRGLLGRGALLFGRPVVRRSLHRGLDEFWSDTAKEAATWPAGLEKLERDVATAGSADTYVHRALWKVLRESPRQAATPDPGAASAAPPHSPGDRSGLHGASRLYQRQVTLHPADPAEVSGADITRLTVTAHDERVRARCRSVNQYRTPPRFTGRLVGPTLEGTIRESLGDTLFSRGYLFVGALMTFVLVFGVWVWSTSGRHDGLPPTIIGLVAAPLFLLLWRSFRASRRPDFEHDADDLEASLRSWLTTRSLS